MKPSYEELEAMLAESLKREHHWKTRAMLSEAGIFKYSAAWISEMKRLGVGEIDEDAVYE